MANSVAYTFDTHAFVKQLVAAKFTEEQAESVCAVVQKSHESATSGFSTKQDILDLRKDIDAKFETQRKDNELLRKDIDAKFDILHAELSWAKWVLGIIAAGIASLVARVLLH